MSQRSSRSSLLPIHNNTGVSRKNQQVEKELLVQLDRYVNVIRRELEKSSTARWTQLRAILIPKLHDSVNQTIRSSLEQSYQLGAEYVTSKVGLQSATFLTHNDIDYIKRLSDEFTDKFFGRVQLSLDNTLRKEYLQEQPDSPINPNFIVTSMAVSATTKALAEGSRQKARSLIVNNGLKLNPPVVLSAADPLLDEEFVIDEFTSIDEIAAQTLIGQQWVWVTAGDPCPICSELEGETWGMEDFDFLPIPIDDTHNNCRCRLVLAESFS